VEGAGGPGDRRAAAPVRHRPWDNTGPIDVFGANREYVGTFAEEDLAMPAAYGPGGLVVYWEFDELDVPTIVVRRIAEVVR